MNLRELLATWGGALLLLATAAALVLWPYAPFASEAEVVEQGLGAILGDAMLYVLAALTGVGGMKGYDAFRARQNGNGSVVNGSVVKHRVGAVEQALEVVHKRIDKLKDEQALMRAQLVEIGRDVAFLRGRADAA